MKILSTRQTREADQYTIENEPISSLKLMERAAKGLARKLTTHFPENSNYRIYCGKGNNGGDGLALARLMCGRACPVKVVVVEHSDNSSDDFASNLEKLQGTGVEITHLESVEEMAEPDPSEILIDGILGSGLSRPLEGMIKEVVQKLNSFDNTRIAIDMPTGLFADDNSENDLERVLKADYTFTFQYPKLGMMHKDTAAFCGQVETIDIGLHPNFINRAESPYHFVTKTEVKDFFKPRQKFSYKGTYGHGLLLAGSKGSVGAAIMSARAALRSGVGLLTVATPSCGLNPLQSNLPEAMVIPDENESRITSHPKLKKFDAIGMGPGIGTAKSTAKVLNKLIQNHGVEMVLDADALNILSENPDWLKLLPKGCVLTPHPGEFKRLLGVDKLESDYLSKLRDFSTRYGMIVVLKDSITAVASPDGEVYFCDFGSPALASPGSGDVLTGVILGLLSSGYSPLRAAILGVFLQGRAGQLAGEEYSLESSLATDVIDNLGHAFRELY